MRCTHCNFDNVAGVTVCQVCATPLEGVACPRCGSLNPSDFHYCGFCGYTMHEAAPKPTTAPAPPVQAVVPPPPPASAPSNGPPPVVLIGFGAILSLAAAAYPWYLFGDPTAAGSTLSEVLEVGWRWFPGAPLALIAVSAVTSTLVSMVRGWNTARPAVAVGSGLVTLLAATWLGEGLTRTELGTTDVGLPATGAVLATIGAIVVISVGLWSFQRSRTSSGGRPSR